MHKLIILALMLLPTTATLLGCDGNSVSSGQEDSIPALDALLDKDPSAMSDELMSSGGWQGRLSYGGNDYRIFEVTLDGKRARLFYLPAETAGAGLRLHMYDVEPFQIGE